MDKWKAGALINLHKMQAFSADLPKDFYVRQEDLLLWGNIKGLMQQSAEHDHPQFVIVGSPGVGKSAFLTLLAFAFARNLSRSVILMRKQEHESRVAYLLVETGKNVVVKGMSML